MQSCPHNPVKRFHFGAALGAALGVLALLPSMSFAQEDPFASMRGALAQLGGCDDIAAEQLATQVLLFDGFVVVVAALLGVALWWMLERRAWSTAVARLVIAASFASVLAEGVTLLVPVWSDAQLVVMSNPACVEHFLLGGLAPFARALLTSLLPANGLCVVLVLAAKKFL